MDLIVNLFLVLWQDVVLDGLEDVGGCFNDLVLHFKKLIAIVVLNDIDRSFLLGDFLLQSVDNLSLFAVIGL